MKCPEQQIHRDRKQITGCQGLGERGCVGRYRISFWGDENVLELDGSDGYTTM